MKKVILLSLLLAGCQVVTWSVPIFDVGDKVMVNHEVLGSVVEIKNRSGGGSNTSDYRVIFKNGYTAWYDEEVLILKRPRPKKWKML